MRIRGAVKMFSTYTMRLRYCKKEGNKSGVLKKQAGRKEGRSDGGIGKKEDKKKEGRW